MPHKKRKNHRKAHIIKAENNETSVKIEDDGNASNDKQGNKKARLIVRNLPFKGLSEDLLRKTFSPYGDVVDVNILKKNDGRFVGCGFIEFKTRQAAAKAIVNLNGKDLSGRPIIVDWALAKNHFMSKVQNMKNSSPAIKVENDDQVKDEPVDDDEEDGDDDDEEEAGDDDDDDGEDDDEEDDDDDEEEDDDFDGNDMEEKDVKHKRHDGEKNVEARRKQSNDVNDGKTLFIKNIPFSAKNDDLRKCVEQFGTVVYAVICMDKLTEHSKGTGFVKFQSPESAQECLRKSRQIYIAEQPLEILLAVSREKLDEEQKKKKAKLKDSRNLYLVREGVVMAGSPAAASISPADMAKRIQLEKWKTQILRNLNMFVSTTRLVVHNLPPTYTDDDLRNLMKKHSPPSAVIKEVRIMLDKKKLDGKSQPISKELGFVSFTNHEDALHALRQLNNNPNVFTAARRPIVSFSIENREILNLKQKRLERSRQKLPSYEVKKGTENMTRKQRRFLKRKELIIKKRQEAKLLQKQKTTSSEGGMKKNKNNVGNDIKANKRKSKTNNQSPNPKIVKTEESKGITKKNDIKTKKRKSANNFEASHPKKAKTEEFEGVEAEPGKKIKMRSSLKLHKQAQIHKNLVKERKKTRKAMLASREKQAKKKKVRSEPPTKMKKPNLDKDTFSKLISSYKNKIENAASFKRWYET